MRGIVNRVTTARLLLFGMPVALLAGAWGVGRVTIDHLLHHDAVMTGQGWATYLADNVKDLDRIAAGQPPSADSQHLFERVQKVGQVFRYVIYDPEGRVRLASNDLDDDDDDTKDADARNVSAVAAMASGEPVVFAHETDEDELKIRPPFFAEAYLPVSVGGRKVGVVETYVDQTEKRDAYRRTLSVTSAALLALMGLAFGIPALAWVRRSREKERADARIHFMAHHDALTGLINRDRLAELAAQLLADAAQAGRATALHYVDIDRFKDVNDTLGHAVGDALIRAVAARLSAGAGPRDSVARVGGDEFVVLQAEPEDGAGARRAAERTVADLARPFEVGGHTLKVTASVGVAVAPGHGDGMARLMKSADLALYRAKGDGRNGCALFSSEMDRELDERLRLERAVRRALAEGGFEVHYQPAVRMPDRQVVGFEALIRLRDDEGKPIPPAVFVPLAERMGLIDEIGAWVLREACREAATWPAHLRVAVNLSPVQLSTGRLTVVVADALAEAGLDARRLELEVTEGMLLDDSAGVMDELRKIKALGVGIVMDDFGTGYSSLSYLWKFPFDKIKIDRAFMLALDGSSNEAPTIVKTIIDLGRSLGVTVTVEGVETEGQLGFVAEAGCDQIQGYYFSRPLPVSDLAAYVLRGVARRASAGAAPEAPARPETAATGLVA